MSLNRRRPACQSVFSLDWFVPIPPTRYNDRAQFEPTLARSDISGLFWSVSGGRNKERGQAFLWRPTTWTTLTENLSMRSEFILALLLAGSVAADEPGPSRDAYVAKDDPLGEPVDKVVYLDQGWSPAVSLKFYFTSQGSQIIPYDWFLALEQADSQTLFRENQNILKYRYLPQLPDSNNPDGLPVGFVGDEGVGRRWLGLTCAACHTNEIRFGTTGYRV